jgi:hypothetical protein
MLRYILFFLAFQILFACLVFFRSNETGNLSTTSGQYTKTENLYNSDSKIEITLIDKNGENVYTLVPENFSQRNDRIQYTEPDSSSEIFTLKLKIGESVTFGKLVLLK